MKLKRYDKRFLPMLWIGLALWLGSMAVSYILEMTGNTPEGQETLMGLGKQLFQTVPVFTLLLLCVFQPIFEEFAFRLWTVGKKWTTIVCLVLMAFFVLSELKWVGLVFLAAFIVVWLCVKNRVTQVWINSIVSSLAFSLSHISGFGDFSIGMVMGLTDIFGMALVLCWLAININFWFAPLLHVLNNSLAIMLPLVILPDPVNSEVKSVVDGEVKESFKTEITPFHALRDNRSLLVGSDDLSALPTFATEFYLVGEPAQIAMKLAQKADTEAMYYYDWVPRNESFEERVVYRVSDRVGPEFDFSCLRDSYLSDISRYLKDTIVADTFEVMLREVWIVYDDGREERLTDSTENRLDVMSGVENLISILEEVNDSTISWNDYSVEKPWEKEKMTLGSFSNMFIQRNYKYDYRDGQQKVKYVIFR